MFGKVRVILWVSGDRAETSKPNHVSGPEDLGGVVGSLLTA